MKISKFPNLRELDLTFGDAVRPRLSWDNNRYSNQQKAIAELLAEITHHTSLTTIHLPDEWRGMLGVGLKHFKLITNTTEPEDSFITKCFSTNTTLTRANTSCNLFNWYCSLNRACKELRAEMFRASVPRDVLEKDIRPFLEDLVQNSKPFRTMKIVVLGHGKIGKTTLLRAIYRILKSRATGPPVGKLFPNLEKEVICFFIF